MRQLVRGNYFREADYWLFVLSVFQFAVKDILIGKLYNTQWTLSRNAVAKYIISNTINTLKNEWNPNDW